MGVPKKHTTSSSRDQRRMHIFLKNPTLGKCLKCAKPVVPHTVCFNCGHYKGRQVLDVMKKLTKKEKKSREREISQKEAQEKKTGGKSLGWEEMSKK